MNKMKLFTRLAAFMANHRPTDLTDMFVGGVPSRRKLKKLRPPRYKPAFSCGYRGWPKTETPLGSVPAPTLDQVRNRERKYGQRIHVKRGIMFFKTDGVMWTKHEAMKRATEDLENVGVEVCHG